MRVLLGCLLLSHLSAQVRLRLGKQFSAQAGLVGVDTVFRLQTAPLVLWVEASSRTVLEWDTLWVIMRTVGKPPVIYALYRSKSNRMIYRGKVAFRGGGIYLLMASPPRQSRLILGRGRVYITDAQAPTVAALRGRMVQQAQATTPAKPTESVPDLSVSMEELELSPEALLGKTEAPPPLDEDLLPDDGDIDIDLPDVGVSDDDFELDDTDIDDIEDL